MISKFVKSARSAKENSNPTSTMTTTQPATIPVDFAATLEANGVRSGMLHSELLRTENFNSHSGSNASVATAASIFSGLSSAHPHQKTFENEVTRVLSFVDQQQEGIEITAKEVFRQADGLATGDIGNVQESYAKVQGLKESTRKIVDDSVALQSFFSNSRKALLEHAAIADEKLPPSVNCTASLKQIIPKSHLNSALVCVVSDTFQALRIAEEKITHGSAGDAVWEAPSSFKRTTTKYWIKDENLTKLMMVCAGEAPLLIYGKKGALTSLNSNDLKKSDGDKLWDSLATVITSIYFDADDMSLYRERIKRAEGAQLLRARWYGTKMPTGEKPVFLELKTHHEKWVAQKSVKERATIHAQDMVKFLRPLAWDPSYAEALILKAQPKLKKNADGLAEQTGLLMRMHNLVVKHNLTACVRTCYDRAAFQSAKSNDLRLTLDRNVTVINEREQQPIAGEWCLGDAAALHAQACVVPFNVFEVKLAGDDPMPPGLAGAESDETMILATKFSKFLTGAAAFNVVPILPYWAADPAFYSFFDMEKRYAESDSSKSGDENGSNYNLMGAASGAVSGILKMPQGVAIAPKNPARIEPKTYFANERTFVQWVSASILLLNISGFLLEAGAIGDYSVTAAVIAFAALILVVYSTALYLKRLVLLRDRHPYGYFNKVNPIFLTSCVVLAILLVWANSVNLQEWFSEGGRRSLRSISSGRHLRETSFKCPQEVIRTALSTGSHPSALLADSNSHSLLMTSNDSVFVQSTTISGVEENVLIRVNHSQLQGLTAVGGRIFAASSGPERTELIELAWWNARDESTRLRIVGRWTIQDSSSRIDGFDFVPSKEPAQPGRFYVNMNSSIHVYSVPDESAHPMRLKSLNMKAFSQRDDQVSTMLTFEGLTHILEPQKNVLEAWNLEDGSLVSEMELPLLDGSWTAFALERRPATSVDSPSLRGRDTLEANDTLVLHLMAGDGQIWSFPASEDTDIPGSLFSVPSCDIETA